MHQASGSILVTHNVLSITAAVLLVALGATGFYVYQQQNQSGIELSVGGRSLTIETR
jgi:hypothetical protein